MILFCPIAIFQKLNHDEWRFGKVMCRLYNSVLYVNMYVQILFLTLMAFDRYLAVVQHGNGIKNIEYSSLNRENSEIPKKTDFTRNESLSKVTICHWPYLSTNVDAWLYSSHANYVPFNLQDREFLLIDFFHLSIWKIPEFLDLCKHYFTSKQYFTRYESEFVQRIRICSTN